MSKIYGELKKSLANGNYIIKYKRQYEIRDGEVYGFDDGEFGKWFKIKLFTIFYAYTINSTTNQTVPKIPTPAKVSDQELLEAQKAFELAEPDGKMWRALGYARVTTGMMEKLEGLGS